MLAGYILNLFLWSLRISLVSFFRWLLEIRFISLSSSFHNSFGFFLDNGIKSDALNPYCLYFFSSAREIFSILINKFSPY